MMDDVLALAITYGMPFLGLVTGLSCLGLPVPVSIAMMIGGSLAASGDIDLVVVFLVAYGSALAGDQAGFWIGRLGGKPILQRLANGSTRAHLLDDARDYAEKRGWIAVFLTRWLFSPLGPYVNLTGAVVGMSWMKFTSASAAGEMVWVVLYTGLGYLFADNVQAVAEIAGNASGLLAAGAVAGLLGWRVWIVLSRASQTD
jgi:membrane-associated protein